VDIGSNAGYPARNLSNFHGYRFVFDDVGCNSMEGLVQAFKHDKFHIQMEICKLVGLAAKRRGQRRNKNWKRVQRLWWKGVEYDRHGEEYQQLLDRAFDALAKNPEFRRSLLATGNVPLTHAIGKSNPHDTVLTAYARGCKKENLMLKFTKLNSAARSIEADGVGGYGRAKELCGSDVARALVIALLRRRFGSECTFPADPAVDEQVEKFMQSEGLLARSTEDS
jgi:hypothetical protein